jgi:hypothetical protein
MTHWRIDILTSLTPFFCSFHCFARDYLQTGYSDMLDISYLFNNNTLSSVLKPKYSLSITNNKKLFNSYNWQSRCPNYQMTAFVFFIFKSTGEEEGWFEKHQFKYFKNLTVKVCKIWCNDVYMSILQCDIFWWKLIDRNFFNPIFNTKVVLRAT